MEALSCKLPQSSPLNSFSTIKRQCHGSYGQYYEPDLLKNKLLLKNKVESATMGHADSGSPAV